MVYLTLYYSYIIYNYAKINYTIRGVYCISISEVTWWNTKFLIWKEKLKQCALYWLYHSFIKY